MIIKRLILLGLTLFAGIAAADGRLFVQSTKAKLLESPDFKANVVSSVPKGNQVVVIEQTGNWIKVKFHDQVGWVSKLLLSPNPPLEKRSVLQGEMDEDKQKARRRASNTATAAATRGLRQNERSRASDSEFADYDALREIEANQVNEKEVWEFNQQKLQDTKQ